MKKVRFLILSLLVIISLSLVPSIMTSAKEDANRQRREKLENAKTYVIGTNLGMVAMYCTNIGSPKFGYSSYEVYEKTGKSDELFRVWLMNSSDKVVSVNPINFKIITKNGYTIPLSSYTYRTRNPFPTTSLEPHTKIDGFIVFEMADEDEILKIIYDDGMGNRVERKYEDAMILGFYVELEELKSSK